MSDALDIQAELAAMEEMTPSQLRDRYLEVCGEPTRSGNKRFMIKSIAWRLQANAEGDLPERVRRKALELARDSDLRTTPPRLVLPGPGGAGVFRRVGFSPVRLPMPGTQLTRNYKGRTVVVTVLADGFACNGVKYASLSGAAKAVTGTHISGNAFFGLTSGGRDRSRR